MARLLRVNRAGAWYHVTARGNERKAIYRGDRDRKHFLDLISCVVTLAELGQAVEAGSRMTLSVALRRFCERLNQDQSLRKRVAEAKNGLQTRGRLPSNV